MALRAAAVIWVFSFLTVPGGAVRAADPVQARIGGTFQYYGQISPAYLMFDDGGKVSRGVVDNSNSNSRLGIWYLRPLRRGQLGINFETAMGFRGSNSVSQNNLFDPWDWSKSSIRKAEIIWETARIGTFYVGQGSMASDGVANRDLSGTSVISYVGMADTAGAYLLRTTSGALSPVAIGLAFPSFDGGRRARVRYDTPEFGGFVLSLSAGYQALADLVDTKDSDITLRYDREFRNFRISAAGGYTWINRKTLANNRTAIGSFSIEHIPTGLSFTSSSGSRDTAGNYRYFKLGYKAELPRLGPLSFSIDYYGASHMVSGGSRSESYGFAVHQRLSNPRLEAYLGIRSYRFTDTTPLEYETAYSVMFGTRWKF